MSSSDTVGSFRQARGFVTKLHFIAGRSAAQLEAILGFHPGRLGTGWHLLFLKEPIGTQEFELAGYTNSSNGRVAERLPSGARISVAIDLLARSRNSAADDRLGTGYAIQKRNAAQAMKLDGPERIVKVVPQLAHMTAVPDLEQYPPGQGIPQWKLTRYKWFIVASFIAPGRVYAGGGADFALPSNPVDAAISSMIT